VSGGPARAFVALALDAELARHVSAEVERALGRSNDLRTTRAEALHLTLFFLGDTERQHLVEIAAELERTLHGLAAPELRLTGTGSFPERGAPRVLWIGLEERARAGRLAALREDVLAALERCAIDVREERERPFRAHLTVARAKVDRPLVPEAFRRLEFDEHWTPREVMLYESHLGGGPARHEALARVALA